MAKRFRKEGSAGMRAPMEAHFGVCFVILSALSPLCSASTPHLKLKGEHRQSAETGQKTLLSATCLSFESQSSARQLKCVCAEGAGDWHNRV